MGGSTAIAYAEYAEYAEYAKMLEKGAVWGVGVVTWIQDWDCYYYQQSVKFGLKLAVSADISADDRDLHEMMIQSSLRLRHWAKRLPCSVIIPCDT
jgi:hypothetical protein